MQNNDSVLSFGRVVRRVGSQTILDTDRPSESPQPRILARGDVALVLGASGAGKSTLLTMFAGLSIPSEGDVRVCGRLWREMRESERDQHRAQFVGYMPQREHLLPTVCALDNVLLPSYFLRRAVDAKAKSHALTLFEELGIGHCAAKKVAALSRGEAQRVCLARALVNSPALVLADEPTANLDDVSAERVIELLNSNVTRRGGALVVATHDARIAQKVPTAQLWRLAAC